MARTKLKVSPVAADTGVNAIANGNFQAGDVANGNYLAGNEIGKAGTLVLYMKNTNGGAQTVKLLAGQGGDLGLGWRSQLGDLTITVPATTGEQIAVIRDTGRFKQADGSISVDISHANVTVASFRLD